MPDVEDPVCKMTFPEETAEELGAIKIVHRGKTRWFCSPTCAHAFTQAPDDYPDRTA